MNILNIFKLNKASFIPLPSLSLITSALFQHSNYKNIADPWIQNKDKYIWLSRSTFSLALIAKIRIEKLNKKRINVFIPDYFCNEALTLIRNENVRIFFYKIDSDLEPCNNSIYNLLEKFTPDLIVQVHYFGKPRKTTFLRKISDQYDSWLVEDATHAMLPVKGIGETADFILYSQYKHFPIPEGSLLVFRNFKLINNINLDLLIEYLDQKSTISQSKTSKLIFNIKWTIKRLIQNYFFNIQINRFNLELKNKLIFRHTGPSISGYSLRILNQEKKKIHKYIEIKHKIYMKIFDSISLLDNVSNENITNYIPYMIKYKCNDNPSIFQSMVNKQSSIWMNFPCLSWPDLAPEVLADTSNHKTAIDYSIDSIYIPVHKSISDTQLDKFYYACKKYKKNNSKNVYTN
tara:strand:- start:11585 stop:12796 length:1212 start_codon:yes stop_codon:yes gene_type:complete